MHTITMNIGAALESHSVIASSTHHSSTITESRGPREEGEGGGWRLPTIRRSTSELSWWPSHGSRSTVREAAAG
uniref:Uncharacterized protein n=1 Tax=Arundo donax TaxID=35708 RepID=A0A0A9GD86_ARUDO